MTNLEKFKEVFGYNIDEDVCLGGVNCHECVCGKFRAEYGSECSNKFWQSEYKEPTETSDDGHMPDEVFDIWVHSFKPKGVDK